MGDDLNLVKKVLKGETQYFSNLVEKYENRVYKTCYRFVRNEEDALDLAQEVFIKVYNNLAGFKHSSSLSTWIYRISVNTCLNYLRKNNRLLLNFEDFNNSLNYRDYKGISEDSGGCDYVSSDGNISPETHIGSDTLGSTSGNPENYVQMKEMLELLDLNLERAGNKSRKIFMYRLSHGMPFKEIGKKIGVTPEAARMNYSRTTRSLRKSFREYQKGE